MSFSFSCQNSVQQSFHNVIENYNVLKAPTDQIKSYFRENPTLYKAALLANHIFRAISMIGLGLISPFSMPVTLALCFAGSLFYRLTVETNCAYKFALPAFAGSVALPLAAGAMGDVIKGVAFASMSAFASSLVCLVPALAYSAYIVLTVGYDVDRR